MEIRVTKKYSDVIDALLKEEVVSFPTETVFGLGVIYNSKSAYEKLIQVKRRPPEKPFTLMCSKKTDVLKLVKKNQIVKALVKKYMPGQFTLIAEFEGELPEWVVSKENLVGVRVPDCRKTLQILKGVGVPLLVPSANRSGEKPLNNHMDVALEFANDVACVLEGESKSQVPSTIVMVKDSNVTIIREGIISREDIFKTIEEATK